MLPVNGPQHLHLTGSSKHGFTTRLYENKGCTSRKYCHETLDMSMHAPFLRLYNSFAHAAVCLHCDR